MQIGIQCESLHFLCVHTNYILSIESYECKNMCVRACAYDI